MPRLTCLLLLVGGPLRGLTQENSRSATSSDGLPCNAVCVGSCKGFTQPSAECAGCDESFTCNPKAESYSEGFIKTSRTSDTSAPGCSTICNSTCCGFTNPADECAACSSEYTCNPKAKCFTGQEERIKTRHQAWRKKRRNRGKGKGRGSKRGGQRSQADE